MNHNKHTFEPLAIVGMSCLFPKAQSISDYWENIKKKVDAISEVPATHWKAEDYYDSDKKRADHVYAKTGGFLDSIDFNPAEWGIAPSDLDSIDTSQLLSLVVARGALNDAGYSDNREFNRDTVSVILGLTGTIELVLPLGARLGHPLWRKAMLHAGISSEITEEVISTLGKAYVGWQENSFPGLLGNVAAGRIANRLDLGGTNCVIDAACGSSLGALEMAAMQLWTHKSDMAITGGVDTFNDIFMYTCFCKTPALSPTGHARPFSEDNDGTIIGEGIGMYVLKRLSDAERDGDRIYACINAVASSSDGKGKAIYAPSAEGQKKALLRAYEESGISPKDIGMVEAHGTGTGAGDQVELAALNEVYGASETGRPWCALGSVKSQIGHTKAAAGSANIIKAALALYHKVIPPTIKVSRPAKILREANSPFYLPKDIRPWITENGKPRHAAVSSMGFGGSNFHVILSEYDQYKTVTEWESGTELFTFSGANSKEIKEKLSALNNAESSSLRKLAAQSRRDFNAESACRLAFMTENGTDVSKLVSEINGQLDTCTDKGFSLPNGATYSQKNENAPVGILFPGQGSQYPGMLADLICSTSEGINTLIEADRETGSVDNFGNRLTDYIYPRPNYDEELDKLNNEKLRSTDIAQPAIGSISLGSFKVLESFGLKASAFAGHSFGELVALSAAGAYDGSTLAKLSRKRGRLMAMGSGDKGGMIAVLGERKTVEEILEKENIDLVVANHNSHKQVVLSGKTSEVERAKDIFKAHKLKGTILNVAGAFHSSFVADAAKPFYDFVKNEKFNNLSVPVYANTTGNKYPENVDEVKSLLGNQLANQVRFVEIIENMYNSGIRTFIEVGPGNVLSGMLKNILNTDDYKVLTLDSSGGKRSSVYDLGRLLGQLSALGYKLDIEKWQNGTDYLKTAANVKSSKFTFKLCGANYKSAKQLEVLANLDKPVTVKPTITKAATSKTEPNNAPVLSNKEPQQTQNFGQVSMNNSIKNETKVTAVTDETIAALQAMQQQTADLHRKFLEGQELAQKTLMALLSGSNAPVLTNTRPAVSEQQRVNVYEPVKAEIKEEPKVVMQKPAERAIKIETPKTELPKVELPKTASVNTDKIRKTLLEVVAEKTGYPTEMLNLDMDMEADLGIDSIKRVEIMSAMQERLPDAPVVQPDQLGKLRTLSQILEYMSANSASASNTAVSQSIVEAPKAAKSGLNTSVVKTALLEVVAEKTGYPTEMLNLDMDMEADLGIDSIKRVEIMSAMQERLPDAPVVQPDQLGKLRTLSQILEYMSANSASASNTAVSQSIVEAPKAAKSGLNTSVVKTALLEVVAEKTGYPTEMLNLDMDMEADLGIDSIKRVEIMSAMQERLPDAPVVQPDQLGKLRTLSQILEYMSANSASADNVSVPQNIAEAAKPNSGLNTNVVKAALLEVVAEKTGYPTDMLNLDMDMEADLGIDSIKRVEIMSAMQERLPDAPVVQPDQLGKLRTLAQIMEHLSVNGGNSSCDSSATGSNTVNSDSSDYDSVLLGVVAEKTGYPVEMLSLDMDMEADLGIDSIKRVEILSGFQEKMPDAPVVQPSDLGNFRTIGQILDFLHSRDCKSSCNTANSTEASVIESKKNSNENLEGSVIRTIIRTVEISPAPDGEKILKSGDTVLISNDDMALAEAVKASFTKAGLKAETRSLAQIIEGQFPIDTKGLVIIAPAPEKALMNLWESSSEEWLKDAFMAIQKAGQAVKLNKGVIATVSRLDGRFGLDTMTKTTDPVQGGLAGIAKTIRYEWSEVAAKAIDLDYRYKDEIEVADRLVAEVSAKSFMEVGLSKNSRIKIEEIESELTEDNSCPANFRKSDVIIVTGGARGVTAETAIAFAEKYKSTMVLIGRSPLPNEEPAWLRGLSDEGAIKKAILSNSGKQLSVKELQAEYHSYMANREVLNNLERIRSFGSDVFYYSADIRNESEIEKIVEKVRIEAGNITGLIHGAGVLRDRRIEDKTREQISDVLDTKVSGLRNILKAISRDNLKVIVLFSSFSGRQGRLGQVDYAMANEVLNKAAQKLRILRPECRVMAFNWGPWDGGMVNSSLRNVFLAEGIGLIPLKAGARCPITELTNPSENAVEIGIMGTLGITDGSTGSLSEATRFTKAFDYNLNVEENTWLRSHVLNGDPVLPMAVAGELMSEAALINNIGMQFIGYNEMRILKGVVLKNSTSQVISVYSSTPKKTDEGYSVICEIRSKSNERETINARAEIILSDTFVESSPEYLNVDAELIYPDSINEVYENDLFHGEFFKSLTEILGWSDKGIKALSKTSPAPSEWFARPIRTSFCSEPMSIDAAYQLMILWTTKVCGAPSLPGYAKKYRKFINNYSDERVIISARARRKGSMMAEADIDFITESGKVAARIEGYECTLNENLKHAFKLRKVIGA